MELASTKPGPKPEIFLVLWLQEALFRLLQAWDDRDGGMVGLLGWTRKIAIQNRRGKNGCPLPTRRISDFVLDSWNLLDMAGHLNDLNEFL